nr:DUF5694 domain-containing protein [Wenzhouxiangella sp. XN201]
MVLMPTMLLITTLCAPALQARDVEVMILGTYHLANPGQDLHNVEVDDVTVPARQEQLEQVAQALATFQPDKIAVEAVSGREDLSLAAFEDFTPDILKQVRNEREQIGYRLAHRLGHEAVYGIDEQSDETDYFPFGVVSEFADSSGRSDAVESLQQMAAALVETMGRMHAEQTIGHALFWINQPRLIDRGHRQFYYGLLELADHEQQPGALLNARYYERNARIFAKLTRVAEPGDRVLVVYGSGHSYWLRHFVEETAGYELVEANTYLAGLIGSR